MYNGNLQDDCVGKSSKGQKEKSRYRRGLGGLMVVERAVTSWPSVAGLVAP